MKKIREIIAVAAVFLPITALWSGSLISQTRTIEVNEMNRRSMPYADTGNYAMVNHAGKHIGIYSGSFSTGHFWSDGFLKVRPGYYILSICEDWIELCRDHTDAVYIIRLAAEDMKYFKESVPDMIPVVVY